MVFSSITFLYVFLPASILLYFFLPQIRWRNAILLITSLVFYAWGEPVYILLMLLTAFINYLLCLWMSKYEKGSAGAKALLSLSIIITLFLLGFFKYSDFLISNVNNIVKTDFDLLKLPLPIGISFYSFQIISYVVDVYRKDAAVQKSYFRFLMYVTSFHQLIAGPIVRYQTIADQIESRDVTFRDFSEGIDRFIIGLGKKVILANACGEIASKILEADLTKMAAAGTWFGIIMFSLQIYFDFSGYSDMAIGMGRMYGFTYLENFNYPYISSSISEFWRRWHISLGSFFRDYVYIPLGGNRKRVYLNLAIVWLLTGLWHGDSWNFVLWGAYFGILIIIEKLFLGKILDKIPKIFGNIYSIIAVVLGWALFYFTDTSKLMECFKSLFGMTAYGWWDFEAESYIVGNIILCAVAILASTPLASIIWKKLFAAKDGKLSYFFYTFRILFNVAILLLCTFLLVGDSYNPFLYFRF